MLVSSGNDRAPTESSASPDDSYISLSQELVSQQACIAPPSYRRTTPTSWKPCTHKETTRNAVFSPAIQTKNTKLEHSCYLFFFTFWQGIQSTAQFCFLPFCFVSKSLSHWVKILKHLTETMHLGNHNTGKKKSKHRKVTFNEVTTRTR